jgi:hypothetical protein
MGTVYKRKKITNLDDLDREEARLRKKTKKIEKEWAELLDPKQLAIDFALSFATGKILGKASPLKSVTSFFSSKKKNTEKNIVGDKKKKNKMGKIIKGIGVGLIAIQAIRLIASFVRKKKEKKQLQYST